MPPKRKSQRFYHPTARNPTTVERPSASTFDIFFTRSSAEIFTFRQSSIKSQPELTASWPEYETLLGRVTELNGGLRDGISR